MIKNLLIALIVFPLAFLYNLNKYVIMFTIGYAKGLVLIIQGKL